MKSDNYLPLKDFCKIIKLSEGGAYCFVKSNEINRITIGGVFYYDTDKALEVRKRNEEIKLTLQQKRGLVFKMCKKKIRPSINTMVKKVGATNFSVRKWIKEFDNEGQEKKPEKEKVDPFKLLASSLGY